MVSTWFPPFLGFYGRFRPVNVSMQQEGQDAAWRHKTVRSNFFQDVLVEAKIAAADDKFLEFDCRPFADPEPRRGKNHIGLNGLILRKLTEHKEFAAFFTDVMQSVLIGTGSGRLKQRLVRVVFYCKKGRHRSVGLAYLAAVALSELSSWAADTVHLANHAWPFDTCNNCGECARPRGQVAQALREAKQTAIDVARRAIGNMILEFQSSCCIA